MLLELKVFNRIFIFKMFYRRKKTKEIQGYTSRCKDGKHIIMLDYDNMPLDWISDELNHIQNKFKLADFIIFKSSEKSFHAVCLNKVSLHELRTIHYETSSDPRHLSVPMSFGSRLVTLRMSEKDEKKPKYVYTLLSDHPMIRECSNAHMILFKKLFPDIPKKLYTNKHYDDLTELIMATYMI